MAFDPSSAQLKTQTIFDPSSAKLKDQFQQESTLTANPYKANEILDKGIGYNADAKQVNFIDGILSTNDIDLETSRAYYNNKFGENFSDIELKEQIRFEYGDKATPSFANSYNKAMRYSENVLKNFAYQLANIPAQMPQMIKEANQLMTKFEENVWRFAGVSEEGIENFKKVKDLKKENILLNPLNWSDGVVKKAEEFVPNLSVKASEFGKEQIAKSEKIQAKYQGSKTIEEAFKDGDAESIAKIIGNAIAFETPALAAQIGISLGLSPAAGIAFQAGRSATIERADLGEETSLERKVLDPMVTATIEAVTERIGTGKILSDITKKQISNNVKKELLTAVARGSISEGTSQFGANVVDLAFGDDVDLKDGVLLSTIVGGIMDGGVSGLASMPYTLGDANRTRKQNSNEEIDVIVESNPLVDSEEKEKMSTMLKSPTPESVKEYNEYVDEQLDNLILNELDKQAPVVESTPVAEPTITEEVKVYPPKPGEDIVVIDESLKTLSDDELDILEKDLDKRLNELEDKLVPSMTDEGLFQNFTQEEINELINVRRQIDSLEVETFRRQREIIEEGDEAFYTLEDMATDFINIAKDNRFVAESANEGLAKLAILIDIANKNNSLKEVANIIDSRKERLERLRDADEIEVFDIALNNLNLKVNEIKNLQKEASTEQAPLAIAKPKPVAEPTPVAKPVIEAPEKTADGIPLVVGISRASNKNLTELFDAEKISKPERIKQTKTIQLAQKEGLQNKTDEIIAKADKKKPLSHKEMGALLLRKTEVVNEIEALQNQLIEATDEDVINNLVAELNDKVEFGTQITEAARKGGTEIARALASMNMQLDRKVFNLVNVTATAKAAKKSELSKQEAKAFRDDLNAIKSFEKELADLDNMSPQEILLFEIENAVRVIRNKQSQPFSRTAALKLIKQRQNKIFSLLETLNGRKPKSKQIKKAEIEDSSGYLSMIESLQQSIKEQKETLKLDAKIHDLEKSLDNNEQIKISPKKRIIKSNIVLEKEARIKDLQRQINRRIDSLKPQSKLQVVGSVYDALRNTKLTGDVGHLLRQGGFVISNPRMWFDETGGRFFRESFKAFTKLNADKTEVEMQSDPDYKKAKEAGLRMIQEGDKLSDREEILMNSLLDKIPVVGSATEAFGRVQITGTNLIRFLTFKSYLANNPNATLDDMKDIAYAVNILTGYGEYKARGGFVEKLLNKALTSPRFTASRIQAPALLALSRGDRKIWNNKALRNRIIEDTSFFIGTRLALMYLASLALPEMEIGDDTDHWSFGRLLVKTDSGKTRIYDPWAGIQGMLRVFAPLISTDVNFGNFAKKLFDGRKHPALSAYQGIMTGENFVGEDITKGEAIMSAFSPIVFETAKEAYQEDTGALDLLAAIVTDAIGIGSSLIDTEKLEKQLKEK